MLNYPKWGNMKHLMNLFSIFISLMIVQAHSSVEKAGLIGLVRMHYLESDDEKLGIDGEALSSAIRKDRDDGLIPFWVSSYMIFSLVINS